METKLTPKWIYAQRINNTTWQIKTLSMKLIPIAETRMFDSVPVEQMAQSEFAVFLFCSNWQDRKPRKYLDCRNKKDRNIYGVSGLINTVDSSFF